MIPVVTPEEMRRIDAAASEPVEVLIERAGAAVAREAMDVLGGVYGRRVVVVAGKGNNGADGRAAAQRLERRGVRVTVFDAADAPPRLPPCDLVIDAAYGTGFRGDYVAPDPGDAFVLAVDVPSGLDALTGEAGKGTVRADATVTFAALKPGLLYDGGAHTGVVTVANIGLPVSTHLALVEPGDLTLPRRPRDAHKYWAAVAIVAGSPGMTGAAALCARGALRAGAGYVRLGVPGGAGDTVGVLEAVGVELPREGWGNAAMDACERMKAVAVGPGLARSPETLDAVRRVVRDAPAPVVVDGDGLFALDASSPIERPDCVLTPHDGEFERLAGRPAGLDRLAAARDLAARLGATVLLKGPVTVVADPRGLARFSTTGGPALATAGVGDVLTGILAAFLAHGLMPMYAGAWAACAHGLAGRALGSGLVASDLPDALPSVLWPR